MPLSLTFLNRMEGFDRQGGLVVFGLGLFTRRDGIGLVCKGLPAFLNQLAFFSEAIDLTPITSITQIGNLWQVAS